MKNRRSGTGSQIAAVAALVAITSHAGANATPIELRKRRELDEYEPCQAADNDFNDDEALKRHELKIQRQDQRRFQQRQQAKFNMNGRR